MDGNAKPILPDGIEASAIPVVDVRAIPLEKLAADADVRRQVRRVLESMEGPSHVRVAAFNSAT